MPEATPGGILLPIEWDTNARELPSIGEIISIGPVAQRKLSVKQGDSVIFTKFAGVPLQRLLEPNVFYVLLRAQDVLAQVRE
jgi:co-chaperonin GroES (HSP10)